MSSARRLVVSMRGVRLVREKGSWGERKHPGDSRSGVCLRKYRRYSCLRRTIGYGLGKIARLLCS